MKLSKIFKKNIERLNQLTNKKISLMSFSYGSKISLYQLNLLSRKFKESYIANWLAITPPFMGAMMAVSNIISGDRSFYESGVKGFTAITSIETISSFESSYQLMKKNIYPEIINEKWFEYITDR